MKYPYIIILLILAAWLKDTGINAQRISFDTKDYKAVGVYDTWEESPFRKGMLKGNCRVVNGQLAVQRSRYGSNTFGARIDLKQTFELTHEYKYVHVFIHKPVGSRAMLVGLGKRRERAGQSHETEQFWVLSKDIVPAGQWTDVVFPIKGSEGVDIYSLVVVPDCESPHNLKEDFACYIDDIEVSDDPTPRCR